MKKSENALPNAQEIQDLLAEYLASDKSQATTMQMLGKAASLAQLHLIFARKDSR